MLLFSFMPSTLVYLMSLWVLTFIQACQPNFNDFIVTFICFFFLTDIFEGIWIFLKLPRTSPMNGDSNSVKKVTLRELPASLVLSAFWDELVLDWLVMGVSLERVDWASSAELNGGKLFGAGGDRWKYRNRKVYNMQQNWSPT